MPLAPQAGFVGVDTARDADRQDQGEVHFLLSCAAAGKAANRRSEQTRAVPTAGDLRVGVRSARQKHTARRKPLSAVHRTVAVGDL